MRYLLFSLILLPMFTGAQINRSAKELASEQIQEYVTTKLFKDLSYKPVSFGQLKTFQDKKDPDVTWTIEHKFKVAEPRRLTDQKSVAPKEYTFQFYLDDKMRVVKADSYFTN